jgi:hypothetical protein
MAAANANEVRTPLDLPSPHARIPHTSAKYTSDRRLSSYEQHVRLSRGSTFPKIPNPASNNAPLRLDFARTFLPGASAVPFAERVIERIRGCTELAKRDGDEIVAYGPRLSGELKLSRRSPFLLRTSLLQWRHC